MIKWLIRIVATLYVGMLVGVPGSGSGTSLTLLR